MIPADVTSQEAVAGAVAAAIDQLGDVDVVVNNAGGSNFMVGFRDLRLSGWDKLIRLNLDSAVYVCHAFAGHLLDRGQGSVINVASVAGVAASPLLSPYGAAKAGLISLTKSLAVEWAAAGVRVNALCPGWTATELNRNLWEDPAAGPATIATVPMQRWGRAEEMAGPAVFLASEASSYMTGQVADRRRRPDRSARSPRDRPGSNANGAAPPRRPPFRVAAGGYSVHHSSSSSLPGLADRLGCPAPPAPGCPAARGRRAGPRARPGPGRRGRCGRGGAWPRRSRRGDGLGAVAPAGADVTAVGAEPRPRARPACA